MEYSDKLLHNDFEIKLYKEFRDIKEPQDPSFLVFFLPCLSKRPPLVLVANAERRHDCLQEGVIHPAPKSGPPPGSQGCLPGR